MSGRAMRYVSSYLPLSTQLSNIILATLDLFHILRLDGLDYTDYN